MDASRVILRVLDDCAVAFQFPVLDNGYFYLAATRLSLFRSAEDWALVTESFGYSPREGSPSIVIQTFASRLHERDRPESFRDRAAYENYLAHHPHDEFRSVHPLGQIDWDDEERVAEGTVDVRLRGRRVRLPPREQYAQHGIELLDHDCVHVFEACRWLATVARDEVLATLEERRVSVRPEMNQLLLLDDWHHPDVVGSELPSAVETFRQLAAVLETGDVRGGSL